MTNRPRQLLVACVALGLLGCTAAGCSTTTAGSSTTTAGRPTTTLTSTTTAALAHLPAAGLAGTGAGYAKVAAASGAGDRSLGTVDVHHGTVDVETVCTGREPLELVGLFTEGPCNNAPGTTSFAAPADGRLVLEVKAPAGTRWAVYVAQPTG